MGMCKLEVNDDSLSLGRSCPVQEGEMAGWMLLDTFDFLVLTPTRPSIHPHPLSLSSLWCPSPT